MEIQVIRRKAFLAVIAAMAFTSAQAGGGCELTLKPTTSGFFLSPTLEKVTVLKVTPGAPEQPCLLMANDELLQINGQVIPGRKAKEVMGYWKALPKSTARIFKVRRAGSVISVVIK